ncbi:MAG: polysaccharide deacetylase family protein [Bacteroidetes bacterium HGW-Bacteroidetes-4]|jgi:peptidoglycan/xylan/chitin deacetylase (PgdA/CDA1 family)|nr:MAG: polysaccharide deacetylase family protein [Bacteroidetes bacterium HGW-Bacteroidetes-4]
MNIHQPPNWLRKIYFSFHWKINNQAKELYLTFDDGPTPEVTEWVLNELATYGAKATFFCIGRNVERHPAIYKNILEQGHAVGNHTYSHLNGWHTWNNEYIDDIRLASDFIKSKLFRPPYGRIRQKQIRSLKKAGYKLFMWDVLSEDYNQTLSPEQSLNYVLQYTEKGSIIVFHDSVKASKNLYAVLPQVLKHFTEQGFTFKKLK